MDRAAFWDLIERVRLRVDAECSDVPILQRQECYAELLSRELEPLSPVELESFQDQLQLAVAEAYTSGLYAAHWLVNGGGSLDGFYYFRAWLVFQGARMYQRAIAEPDSLAEICTLRGVVADYECEEVLNVAKALFRERTGEMMDWRSDPGDLGQEMPGERWEEYDLPTKLPRLSRIHTES
jgi:hypothetical protein